MTAAEIALADTLLTQGLAYWAQFQAQKANGALTQADLGAAMAKLQSDVSQLAADIAAQQTSMAQLKAAV